MVKPELHLQFSPGVCAAVGCFDISSCLCVFLHSSSHLSPLPLCISSFFSLSRSPSFSLFMPLNLLSSLHPTRASRHITWALIYLHNDTISLAFALGLFILVSLIFSPAPSLKRVLPFRNVPHMTPPSELFLISINFKICFLGVVII